MNPSSANAINEARLFRRLRWRLFRNATRQVLQETTLRPVTILWVCIVVWVFVFLVSLAGFRFMAANKVPMAGTVVGTLFALMFLTLGGMLVFSTGLILYGSLFAAPETTYLLSKPVRADHIFAFKFQGALAFSSSAFLLLGSPILIAYGVVCTAPWFFYLLLPLFFLGYVLLPGSFGGLACLLLVNYLPRHRKQVIFLALLLILGGALAWLVQLYQNAHPADPASMTRDALNRLLGRFQFARLHFLPSEWVAAGLQAAGRGKVGAAAYHLALLWTNGLFLYVLTAWAAARLYRRGVNVVATGGTLRKRYGGHWLDAALETLLFFVQPLTRRLIVKDFRTFRRDPQQWAQVLIFSSLIALYLTNIRRMFLGEISRGYQNGISLLNLTAISLLVCIYTGRFIFPMLSLEGRKMWLLGLLPLQREQLLWGKFAFSATGALVIAETLVGLSDFMLQIPWDGMLLHVLTVAVMSAGLSALSVGMGACLPNFRETDPSKIAVGFGGTLNLITGLVFLLGVLAIMAAPWHICMLQEEGHFLRSPLFSAIVLGGTILGVAVGALAVIVPLRWGVRSLRQMEF